NFVVRQKEFQSLDGRSLPVTVYMKKIWSYFSAPSVYLDRAIEVLTELESDYGAFPHSGMLIYASPAFQGGMEYAGATITNFKALAHEITHSYFGRGLMPANGNAAWIDEALASWRDD